MKTAIIIGASSGIGRALAIKLHREGYFLGLAARRVDLLESLLSEINGQGIIRKMDAAEPEQARLVLNEMLAELKRVDLFIYNAGVSSHSRDGDWTIDEQTIRVNVMSFVALCDFVTPELIAQKSGHVVGVSSLIAVRGNGRSTLYCATKSFMSAYLQGLRQRFFAHGISVTDIRPGFVDTEILRERKRLFWVATPEKAAEDIYVAIRRKEKVAYIPRRWFWVGLLLCLLPDFLYDRGYVAWMKREAAVAGE